MPTSYWAGNAWWMSTQVSRFRCEQAPDELPSATLISEYHVQVNTRVVQAWQKHHSKHSRSGAGRRHVGFRNQVSTARTLAFRVDMRRATGRRRRACKKRFCIVVTKQGLRELHSHLLLYTATLNQSINYISCLWDPTGRSADSN